MGRWYCSRNGPANVASEIRVTVDQALFTENGSAKFGVLFTGYCIILDTRFSTILETQDLPDQLKYQGQGRVVTFG